MPWRCERCGSDRWVGWRAGPAHEGFTRYAQCVPCGKVQDLPQSREERPMSDPGTVMFTLGETVDPDALVYVHHLGSELPDLLDQFFTDELSKIGPRYDNRFDDTEYLAARFVAFLFRTHPSAGIGVGNPTVGYDGTQYLVVCDGHDQNPPRVTRPVQ